VEQCAGGDCMPWGSVWAELIGCAGVAWMPVGTGGSGVEEDGGMLKVCWQWCRWKQCNGVLRRVEDWRLPVLQAMGAPLM
jgi:hypothetical protein